ncbi:AAA family ATPase [Streptomyces violaceus]|uniref:AAA family ATPase n=1 Tax=Streptomyces violaceus TaxID=1936 RepID=UPI002E2E4642|nr:AAA family ATPase [Streptomyces violaceus]
MTTRTSGIPATALLARLAELRDRVALLVEHRSAGDPTAGDPLRGLYLSEEAVRHLLRPAEPLPLTCPGTGGPPKPGAGPDRLAGLSARLRLTELDTALLLIALAPDLDRGFEPLYGYLNDDVSRRRATVALALDLCGIPVHLAEGRARLHPAAPLSAFGLLTVEEPERPFLSRALRVPDRLVAHLLGDDTPDVSLTGHLQALPAPGPGQDAPAPGTDLRDPDHGSPGPRTDLRDPDHGSPGPRADLRVPDQVVPAPRADPREPGQDTPTPDTGHSEPGQDAPVPRTNPRDPDQDAPAPRTNPRDPDQDAPAPRTNPRDPDQDTPAPRTNPRDPDQDTPAPRTNPRGPAPDDEADRIARRLAARLVSGPPLTVYLRERREGDGLPCVTAALRAADVAAVRFTGPEDLVPDLLREARLSDRAVVVTGLPEQPAALFRELAAAVDVPVLVTGSRPYDPRWCDQDPLVLEAPARRAGAVDAWSAALGGEPGFDLAATVAPYHLAGDHITRAARAARGLADFDGTPLSPAHLRLAARQQSASGLEQHARRIRPDVDWRDLVLPDGPLTQLRELALRARHRDRVLGDWRLSAGGGRGRGVLGLFAGESGTGKTLSAEVVAADLGLDLYVVQLSSVVDKYVGETEKNLERIFTEADRTDAVLLFDEADAVFGKRSEVKDAHDRYANLESAYLLQRLESFDGIALLTTNLRANIDEAFTRRLDLIVDFPFPDAGQRLALWRHSLSHVPRADGIALDAVANGFELAGGSIRSAVVTAAYLAAGRGGHVTADDLLEGARREYRKAGRLVPGEGTW